MLWCNPVSICNDEHTHCGHYHGKHLSRADSLVKHRNAESVGEESGAIVNGSEVGGGCKIHGNVPRCAGKGKNASNVCCTLVSARTIFRDILEGKEVRRGGGEGESFAIPVVNAMKPHGEICDSRGDKLNVLYRTICAVCVSSSMCLRIKTFHGRDRFWSRKIRSCVGQRKIQDPCVR